VGRKAPAKPELVFLLIIAMRAQGEPEAAEAISLIIDNCLLIIGY